MNETVSLNSSYRKCVCFYGSVVSKSVATDHTVNGIWAYLSHNFIKDRLCACVCKSRNAVLVEIYDDFMVQQVYSYD